MLSGLALPLYDKGVLLRKYLLLVAQQRRDAEVRLLSQWSVIRSSHHQKGGMAGAHDSHCVEVHS